MSAIRISDTQLDGPAEHRVTPDGLSLIVYRFLQKGRRTVLHGTQRMGSGAAAAAVASAKAAQLRRGVSVTVYAAGIEKVRGEVRVMDIELVEPVAPAPRSEVAQ